MPRVPASMSSRPKMAPQNPGLALSSEIVGISQPANERDGFRSRPNRAAFPLHRASKQALKSFRHRWLKEKWSVESVLRGPIQPLGQCLSCTLNNLETSSTSGIQSVPVSACFTPQTRTASGIFIPCFRSARSFRSDIILITRPVITKPSRAKCSSPL